MDYSRTLEGFSLAPRVEDHAIEAANILMKMEKALQKLADAPWQSLWSFKRSTEQFHGGRLSYSASFVSEGRLAGVCELRRHLKMSMTKFIGLMTTIFGLVGP
jgi:hypothetical protein